MGIVKGHNNELHSWIFSLDMRSKLADRSIAAPVSVSAAAGHCALDIRSVRDIL